MEDELDEVSGGRAEWKARARGVLARLQAQDRRGHGAQAARKSPRRSTSSSTTTCSRRSADGADPRLCPKCGRGARSALRGRPFGAFVACSNYPECTFTRKFAPARRQTARAATTATRHRSRQRARDRPQVRPVRALRPARRGQGGQARLDPQGPARLRPRLGDQAAEPAARRSARIPRPATRSPPASAATAPTSRTTASTPSSRGTARGVRDRHERRGHAARRSRQRRRRGGGRAKAEPIKTLRRRTRPRRRDQGHARPLRPLRHRRHHQRHPAARHASPRI